MDLPFVWFVLLGILLAGYTILDGFDLGVGILHYVARSDHDRRLFLNAIGPIWDGNEVWLVAFGGALLAAFPEAYATLLSGFYIPVMMVLFALIFRAVSIEFRSKLKAQLWRQSWDFGFFSSSVVAAFLFGLAAGNTIIGIPLNPRGIFVGTIWDLVSPYPILVGLLVVALFAMHGALYLYLKIPHGTLHDRIREWMWHTWGIFLVSYMLTTVYTLTTIPRAVPNFVQAPWAAGVVVLSVLAIANIPRAIYHNAPGQAFISSGVAILMLVVLLSLALWPNLVPASNNPAFSLTIYRAASSDKTLWIMFIVALTGMPLVLTYTTIVYWTFRRRVEIGERSY